MTAKKTTKPAAAAAKPAVKPAAKPTAAPAKPTAAEKVEALETVVAAGKETIDTVVKAGTEAAQQGVDTAVAMSTEQVAAAVKAGTEAFKNYEDVVGFGKENIDAVVAANTELVKGLQRLNTRFFDLAKVSLHKNAAATKQMFACKSPEEFFTVQSDLAKASYDDAVVEFQKFSELTVQVAEDSVAPITKQVTVTVEKFTKPLAA